MNRRAFLTACPFLAGCAGPALLPDGSRYHPITSFRWFRAREVTKATIRVIESADIGPMCSARTGHLSAACGEEFGPEHIVYVPPDDPMMLAHEALHRLGWDHEIPEWATPYKAAA